MTSGTVDCRQEYWSGLTFPSPGDLPDPGIEPKSPTLQADSLLSEPAGEPRPPGTSPHMLSVTDYNKEKLMVPSDNNSNNNNYYYYHGLLV